MARRSFFFVTFTICNILVKGQTPAPAVPPTPLTATPTPAVPTGTSSLVITFSEEAKLLPAKCLTEVSFPVGESIWWVGAIIVNPDAPPCTLSKPATTTPPVTAPPVTTPPVTTPPVTTPPVTTPPVTTPPVTTPPVTTPPVTTPPVTTPPVTTPPVTTPPPATAPPATPVNLDNKCSLLSYTGDCKGCRLLISKNEDGSICLKEAVFNEKLGTVALFKTTWIADKERAAYQSMFGFYGTMDKDGKMSIAQTTPDDFKQTQKAEFVVIGAGKAKDWAVVTSSNKSVVFVIYNQQVVVDEKAAEPFKAEIEGIITQIGLKVDQLKPVPREICVKLDHFIAPVGETVPPPPPQKP